MWQKKKIEIRMNKIKLIKTRDKVMNFFKDMDFRIWHCETKQSQDKLLATDFIIRGRKE